MLAHTACLCGNPSLLPEFEKRRREIPVNASRRQSNLSMLQQDIEDNDFLPQHDLLETNYRANVKSSIYRFPSILAYNLKVFYSVESKTSFHGRHWMSYYRKVCSRTAAYTYHHSQNNDMTFLPALSHPEDR